jgi:peptide/nickel transport system permease protein
MGSVKAVSNVGSYLVAADQVFPTVCLGAPGGAIAANLVLRELLFVDAARVLDVSTPRILWVHILPNLMSPVLVQLSFIFANAILAEAGLSFLGVGVPSDIPTWGTMIAGSLAYSDRAFWTILSPGLALVLTAASLPMLGDGVRGLVCAP